jgi:simple sugar transport system permease protein
MMPFALTVEKAESASPAKVACVVSLSIAAALLAGGSLFTLYGLNPFTTLQMVFARTLGSVHGWSEVVRRGTPVLIIGLGMLAGARAQFWNLGADGQVLAGAVAASGIALYSGLPGPLLFPVMAGAGMIAASIWALVPCLLKARLGINEIVTGLMMNYMAANLVDWLVQGPWRGSSAMGYSYTDAFPLAAWLPLVPGTRISWVMTLVGIVAAVVFHGIVFHTATGFRIRVFGEGPAAARYAGIRALHVLFTVALAAGGMAGLAGVGEVASVHHKLLSPDRITNGYGFIAVIAAMLARGKPLLLIPTSFLLGIILATGDVITVVLHLPMAVLSIFTGLILYFLVCGDFFLHYRLRLRWRFQTAEVPA